jgi:hypothetical protein
MSLLDTLIMAESNGRNIPNVTDSGPGPGGGYFQIKDGTWSIYARRAGIDLAKFPSAMSAPYEIQKQVADVIPIGQWGPRTKRLVRAAGYNIDESKTLAENIAAVGEAGIVPKLSDAGRQLSPQTANLGPAPKGVAYGEDKTAGPSGEASPAAQIAALDAAAKPTLASAFGDALGKMQFGGSGGSGGSSGGLSGWQDLGNLGLQTASAMVPDTPETKPNLSQLADVFATPTIGQANKIKPISIASKSWT